MAEATLQGIWTQKGLDKETAFRAGGERKKLTHVAVGDGNGSIPLVSAAQTGLVNEVWRGLANAVMVNPDDPTDLLVDVVIPNNVGGFWIREWGIFDEDGDLVAVGPHDEMHKPLISTGQAAEFLERFHLPSANATFVEIKIASQALATQQYVESKISEHDADAKAHEILARKSVQIKAGTGLTGGGTLEADRTLTVKYGSTAGTACQGNDVRLSDARTPKAHKATHKTGGTDALTPADIGAAPASHTSVEATDTMLGHAKASKTTPKAAGTAATGTETGTFARGDHVHPAQTTITGNAGTATKLATARTISLSGDATGSTTFDGSANKSIPVTLAESGVDAGAYGPTAAATLAFGGSVNVPQITVDAKGRATAVANRAIKLPAAPTSVSGNAGTATKLATARTIDGVSFNGSANIIHYGTCATGAATAAKAVNCTGFVLATGARIAVRFTVTNTAANPTLNVNATGAKAIRYRNAAITAGYLAENRTYDFVYDGTYFQLIGDIDTDTKYAVATQAKNGLLSAADKKSLDYCEALRLSMIGVPRYWRSTTLPENHVWANGDLVLFSDWPELKKVYDDGGFSGMLLAYNADSTTIAANLGKWRPNAANPTGLYVPKLNDQFFRAWASGAGREAGKWQEDAVQPGFTQLLGRQAGKGGGCVGPVSASGGVTLTTKDTAIQYGLVSETGELAMQYTWKSTQRTADETHPVNIAIPVILYLGLCS